MQDQKIEIKGEHQSTIEIKSEPEQIIGVTNDATIIVGSELYDGEYEVTPKSSEQVLNTKKKIMYDDVTVGAIPYYEVSNDYGGITVNIGG